MINKALLFTCDLCGRQVYVFTETGVIFPKDWMHFPSGVMQTKHRCNACPPQKDEKPGGVR